jgi:arabinose-5-phosphate isomerase
LNPENKSNQVDFQKVALETLRIEEHAIEF